jgi:integrase
MRLSYRSGLIARQRRCAIRKGLGAPGFAITSPLGGPLTLDVLRNHHFHPATHRASLDELTVCDLRHTCISLWLGSGIDPVKVCRWAGHASIAFAMDYFGHLVPGTEAADVADIEVAFS